MALETRMAALLLAVAAAAMVLESGGLARGAPILDPAPPGSVAPRTCMVEELTTEEKLLQVKRLDLVYGGLTAEARAALDDFQDMVVPVIFHVIHVDGVRGYASEELLQAQIDVMNRGFGGRTNRAAANTGISFTLDRVNYIQSQMSEK